MIEINLVEKKKKFKAPVVLGMDLGKLPWKGIIVTYLIATFPHGYIQEYFDAELKKDEEEITKLNQEFRKLRSELVKNGNIKEQLDAFNKQIEKLKTRSEQVNKIIKAKTNPRFILEKMARTTPEDMWFNRLSIDDENKIAIEGASDSYTSIGDFIVNLNESPFFGRSLQLTDSKTEEEQAAGSTISERKEVFKIEGKVEVYNPFSGES